MITHPNCQPASLENPKRCCWMLDTSPKNERMAGGSGGSYRHRIQSAELTLLGGNLSFKFQNSVYSVQQRSWGLVNQNRFTNLAIELKGPRLGRCESPSNSSASITHALVHRLVFVIRCSLRSSFSAPGFVISSPLVPPLV